MPISRKRTQGGSTSAFFLPCQTITAWNSGYYFSRRPPVYLPSAILPLSLPHISCPSRGVRETGKEWNWEREKSTVLEGEVAMFCLPVREAREEEERKRRERGCEDHRLFFPCQPLYSFRWTSALGLPSFGCYGRNLVLTPDLSWLEDKISDICWGQILVGKLCVWVNWFWEVIWRLLN